MRKNRKLCVVAGIIVFCMILSGVAYSRNLDAETQKLATLEENEIDIGYAALLFAKEVFPDLNVKEYSQKLDAIANKIKPIVAGSTDPDRRIRAINTYLYKIEGFHFNKDDMYGYDLDNRYINRLMDTKSGNCFSMPILYLAITQRLKYPIYLVAAPQHLFLRYVDPDIKRPNIEATSNGGFSNDKSYVEDMDIPWQGVRTGAYMRTMTYKEALAELFAENASYWARKRNEAKANQYFEEALRLNPRNAEVYRIYGNFKTYMVQFINIELAKEENKLVIDPSIGIKARPLRIKKMSEANALIKRANLLGVAKPLPKNYWVMQKEKQKQGN